MLDVVINPFYTSVAALVCRRPQAGAECCGQSLRPELPVFGPAGCAYIRDQKGPEGISRGRFWISCGDERIAVTW